MPSQNSSQHVQGRSGKALPLDKTNRLPTNEIPSRYSIREIGSEKALSCIEAPNLAVYIKFGLSVPAQALGKAASGSIFLDGVAQSGPLLDHTRQVYNFDHHEGCVRSFTLSTCEQVLLMIKKGLDLRSREWKIYANDPDLDTILAIWLMLNHIRINEQESIREHILFPLIRLQGSIDSLGLELKNLTGLPPALLNQCQRIIDHLRRKELQIKKDGQWEQTDFLEYTAGILNEIDQIVYEPQKMGKLLGIEELARVNLSDNRVAVILQSDLGIYEIEPQLKKIYGGNISLAFLRKSKTVYTLRKVDTFFEGKLEDVYEKLNFIDPAVKYRNLNNKWGGSSDIGGSPRESGTRLNPEEIAQACKETFQKYSFLQQLFQFILITLCGLVVIIGADVTAAYWNPGIWFHKPGLDELFADPYTGLCLVMLLLTSVILVGIAERRFWQFGIIWPLGRKWYLFLLIAIPAGVAGGAWIPMCRSLEANFAGLRLFVACLLLPFAAEYLFRGLLHGMVAQKSKIQNNSSNYFVSKANLTTSFLFTLSLTFLPTFQDSSPHFFLFHFQSGWMYLNAFIFSLALGFVRERSHSFFAAYLAHLAPVFCVIFWPTALMMASRMQQFIAQLVRFLF